MPDAFALYSNLEILDMARADDVSILRAHLQPEFGATHAVESILYSMLHPDSGTGAPRCKAVVVEKDYVDAEFSNSYGRFYYHLYVDVPKRCTRLHFFSEEITEDMLADLEGRDTYLGYVVVRPIAVMPVGRTVLAHLRDAEDEEFVLTQATYTVNLSGSRLQVVGMPFIQQDGRVAACASASLWMATDYMSSKFQLPAKSSIEITELATGYDFTASRSAPEPGLTTMEVASSFKAMGYSPHVYERPWTREAKQIIYSCVESKIPALLALSLKDHHAVVTIGHTFRSPENPELRTDQIDGVDLTYYDNVDWIPEFIVHDDQGGLYGRLRMLSIEDFVIEEDIVDGKIKDDARIDTEKLPLPAGTEATIKEIHCPVELKFPYYDDGLEDEETRLGNLFAIVVPMPPGVSLLAEEASMKARELLVIANSLYGSPNLDEIVLRTFLERSNDYKESLQHRGDMSDWLRRFYRGKTMSRYIWITEISTRTLFDKPALADRRMVGEIIMDSAASPYTPSFLALHVPGYVMTMDHDDKNHVRALQRAKNIPDDRPYSHSIRGL